MQVNGVGDNDILPVWSHPMLNMKVRRSKERPGRLGLREPTGRPDIIIWLWLHELPPLY